MFLCLPGNKRATNKDRVRRQQASIRGITSPRSIRVGLELERARAGEEKTMRNRATKISKNMEEMTIVDMGGG